MNPLFPCITAFERGTRLRVLVQPNSSRSGFNGMREDTLRIRLTAPPVDGAANKALVAFLSKAWNLSKKDVLLIRGERSRRKTVQLSLPPEQVMSLIRKSLDS